MVFKAVASEVHGLEMLDPTNSLARLLSTFQSKELRKILYLQCKYKEQQRVCVQKSEGDSSGANPRATAKNPSLH